jgi:outer membrane protein assembly factor BamB
VVVGDFEGYVHWIAVEDGRIAARLRVDSDGVLVRPLVLGDTVYVFGNGGTLAALRAD